MKERRVYTAEFKREAVRLCEQPGASVVQIAEELGVSDHSLYKLRKELERVTQERDILKKATVFFAKESK